MNIHKTRKTPSEITREDLSNAAAVSKGRDVTMEMLKEVARLHNIDLPSNHRKEEWVRQIYSNWPVQPTKAQRLVTGPASGTRAKKSHPQPRLRVQRVSSPQTLSSSSLEHSDSLESMDIQPIVQTEEKEAKERVVLSLTRRTRYPGWPTQLEEASTALKEHSWRGIPG